MAFMLPLPLIPTLPEGTLTFSGIAAFLGLLIKVYNLGRSDERLRKEDEKLRTEVNGLGNFTRKGVQEKHELRLNNLEKALLIVSKHDPETRRIVEILTEPVKVPAKEIEKVPE